MEHVKVIHDRKTIIIASAQPDVIFVPYYDTRLVYGNWHWSHYPPVYWQLTHHNKHLYRATHSPFYWHTGVHISFNFFFNAFHWHERHIVATHYRNTRHQVSYGRLVKNHHARRWQHNPSHRRGVSYSTAQLKQRYHSNRPDLSARKVARSGGFQKSHNQQYVAQNRETTVLKTKQVVRTTKPRGKHQQLTDKLKDKRFKVRTNHGHKPDVKVTKVVRSKTVERSKNGETKVTRTVKIKKIHRPVKVKNRPKQVNSRRAIHQEKRGKVHP
jgi:Tfp pilus assembly protein PilV